MRFSIKIVLFITFALVFTRANVFGQVIPQALSKVQPVRSVNLSVFRTLLDSVVAEHQLKVAQVRIVGDSLDESMQEFFRKNSATTAIATVVIKRLLAYTEENCRDCEVDIRRHSFTQTIVCEGVIAFDEVGKPTVPFSRSYSGSFSAEQSPVLQSQPVIESKSFWESTAQPMIVGIGAAVVVALFFLIRS